MARQFGLLTLVLAALWCAPARGDLLPLDQRFVHHDQFVDNLGDYPNYVFYVANDKRPPAPGDILPSFWVSQTPWYRLDPAGEISHTHFGRVQLAAYLYAVPRPLAEQEAIGAWFWEPTPGVLKSDVPLASTGEWVPLDSSLDGIVTHYRIELTDAALRLHVVRSERREAAMSQRSRVLVGCSAALAISIIWVVYARRSRRRTAAAH